MRRLLTLALMATSMAFFAPAQQTVTGSSNTGAFGSNGSPTTGTNYGGAAGANYNVGGTNYASGNSAANTTGSGYTWTGPGAASSQANGAANSQVTGDGNTKVQLGVTGTAVQGNWAGTGSEASHNWANAGNSTQGSYSGTASGTSPMQMSGQAGAMGNSAVMATSTPTTANSTVYTGGSSQASLWGGQVTDPTVSGKGSAGSESFVGNTGGTFADAWNNGTAAYNGSGAQSAQGSLVIKGTNSANIGSNSVAASSTMGSTAQAGPVGHP